MAKGSDGVQKAFGYLLKDELPALKKTIALLPPNSVCINIGAGSGTSGLAFLESGNVGTLYTIDIFGGDRAEGGLGNEKVAMKDSGYWPDPRYHPVCGDSTQVGLGWSNGKVNMVFIDGDHSYEHCKSDIESWLPHIKYGGIMALHDYYRDVWPGVAKATDEILSKYDIIFHVDTYISFWIR